MVLKNLLENNFIDKKEYEKLIKEKIKVKKSKKIFIYEYMKCIKLRNQFNDILDLNGKFCKLVFIK